ncbi:ORF6N domain-containing protein [Bacteroides caccae]|nr:ORF6N domain-containing protein [Bacteroides caccae]RHG48789.1 ORF6N domain-containing protein [Bacteroides caccae]
MMELQIIQNKIYEIRGQKVMLDFDLAALYGVETGQLKRSVRRNIERFEGEDFMFEVTREELSRCQIGILNEGRGGNIKYLPFAFTELGVAMLSSVLHSTTAIDINRNIMRAFVSIRQYVLASDTKNQEIDELRQRIQELESQGSKAFVMINQIGEETLEAINDLSEDTRKELDSIYLALSELADKEKTESLKSKHRRPIGFIHYDNEE